MSKERPKENKIKDIYLLSPMQEGMLYHSLLDQESNAYFEQSSLSVKGKLDIRDLEASLNWLIARYDILRTVFIYENVDKPVQAVMKTRQAQICFEDISQLPAGEKKPFMEEFKQADRRRGFDLRKDLPLRISVLKTDNESYELIWSFHHIIMDGWCMAIIRREFLAIYNSLRKNSEPDLPKVYPYSDYIKWLAKQDRQEAALYWQEYLTGYEETASLPQFGGTGAGKKYEPAEVSFRLTQRTRKGLEELAGKNSVTLNTVIQAAWGILLQQYNDVADVVFGAVVSGRPHEIAGIETMVGLFINTLPVRIQCGQEDTFTGLIKAIQHSAVESERYSYYPLAEIQAKTSLKSNLIDHIVAFENYPAEAGLNAAEAGITIGAAEAYEQTNYDFNLIAVLSNELIIKFKYNALVYEPRFVAQLKGHFLAVIDQVLRNPAVSVKDIDLLTGEERQELLDGFNRTRTEYPQNRTVVGLFEEQAAKVRDNTAVTLGMERLSYQELNGKANQLARQLRQKGIKANHVVGILAERSPAMLVGLLGILKAGAAYLPIDPDYPAERVGYMLADSGATVLLTQRDLAGKTAFTGETVDLEDHQLYSGDRTNLYLQQKPDDLAYVIYTSGSTGKPKGVEIEHASLVNLITWHQRTYSLSAADRATLLAGPAFDAAVWEIWPYLTAGAGLYIPNQEIRSSLSGLIRWLRETGITVSFMPTPLAEALLGEEWPADAPLRALLTGGDQLHRRPPRNLPFDLVNHYGPTESTVVATCAKVDPAGAGDMLPSIGRPIDNTRIYIVGKNNQLQPVGVDGELCIGGDGLARGYLNRPELTAEKFIANPFIPGERMYRTGDLARWLPDGSLEYLGRMDQQVKIRGFRVELGEIEAELGKHPAVRETVVLAKDDGAGGKYLCAYLVTGRKVAVAELREHLNRGLPGYMVPAAFVELAAIPLTPNGKIDRNALPEPEAGIHTGTEYVAPANETEARMARLWQEVLGVERVGMKDNFFELGGHSLKTITLAARIHKEFGVEVSLTDLFKAPTIQELVKNMAGRAATDYGAIEPAPRQEYYPVSPAQRRMFILQQFGSNDTTYNLPGVFKVEGLLDRQRLQDALQKLIQRHETLRTSFEFAGGEPVQRVHPDVAFAIASLQGTEADIDSLLKTFIRPFDLSQTPLLRLGLLKLAADRHVLFFDMHHIISDGVSMGILVKELADLYRGQGLPELRIQYKDYSVWQNKMQQGERLRKQEEFWLQTFAGEVPVLNLPGDYPRPAVKSFAGDRLRFVLEDQLTGEINKLTRQTGTTLYMVLLAAFNVLLAKYSGQEDIVVGSPITGRPHADLEHLVGMFVNTLSLRNFPAKDKNFLHFLQEVKANALAAYEHQDYQFEDLVDKLALPRDLSRNPLFDVMFSLQNRRESAAQIGDLQFSAVPFAHKTAKFDLNIEAVEMGGHLEITLEYSTKLFKRETAARLGRHFVNLLQSIVIQPAEKLTDLEMLTEDEKKQLLQEFNQTGKVYPRDKTVQELFEAQAAKTPANIAVVFAGKQLTYQELNSKANQLARVLRSKGVQPDSIVGIMVDRSPEMMLGILAILKAGGAYLPIDPDYPAERIRYMLEDSGVTLLLTQSRLVAAVPFSGHTIDVEHPGLYTGDAANLPLINRPRDLAYVIYTSGSTGNPKGVEIEHHSLINMLSWLQNRYPLTEDDVILQKTPFTFDASVWELFWWGMAGAQLCFLKPKGEKDPAEIVQAVRENKVTIVQFVPSLLTMLLEYMEENNIAPLASLKKVFAGGEALQYQQVARFHKLFNQQPAVKLINQYGPTEATIDASYFDCGPERETESIPIGKPIDNTQLYILAENNQLQPIGAAGELCIGGDGLARGYLNRPELTAAKFVANPFAPGERIYRTGDLARWLPDGNIEYLGRIDHQVKIRGFRIELGEIETELLKQPSVREVVVMARKDRNGERYLCAYFTADQELTIEELRRHLAKKLPDYMVPSSFVQLEKMPLTPNGKINRQVLPEPDGSLNTGIVYVAPRNEMEAKLVQIWQDVLQVAKVGIDDNFFALGGHSLKAITLATKIHKELGADVSLTELFKAPTVRELAKAVESTAENDYASIEPAAGQEYYPVSSAQKRMFILNRFQAEDTTYNMPAVFRVTGILDKQRLEDSLQKLIQRHEAFRTSFEVLHGEPVQQIHAGVEFTVERISGTEATIPAITQNFVRPFDLSQAPLLRAGLVELAEEEHVLLFDMHHIIGDGVSLRILVKELTQLYGGQKLPALRVQYKDFAVWQNAMFRTEAFKKQEAYWLRTFAGELPVLTLPGDYPRPAVRSFEGGRLTFSLGEEVTEQLNRLALETGTTLYMVLLAAYNVLLAKYSGQEDIIVGSPIAGRPHADLENMVGMFVNTLAMRNYPEQQKNFRQFLQEVRANALDAYEHQDYQFEELVDKLDIPRQLNRNPLFDTMFALQTADTAALQMDGLQFSPYEVEHKTAKFDLTLEAMVLNNRLECLVEYYTQLFKPATAERLAEHFMAVLSAIIAQPDSKLADIELLTATEREQLLAGFNPATTEYPRDKTIPELFEEQAAQNPDRIAVTFGDRQLTYAELNRRANQLARALRRRGVTANTIVGLLLDRSPAMITGILGILKAGGAYLPIDPDYPPDRIAYMLADSGARLLITRPELSTAAGFAGDLLDVDDPALYQGDTANLTKENTARDLAYVIYTSGSTGKPKGNLTMHTNVVRVVKNTNYITITGSDVLLQLSNYAFDGSVFDIYGALLNGARLVLIDKAAVLDMPRLARIIETEQVTVFFITTALFNTLVDVNLESLKQVRKILFGGEAASPRHVKKAFTALGKGRVVNMYGPTETTVFATYHEINGLADTEGNIPIGKPVANTRLYILDPEGRLQPVGVTGELCIAGDGLAQGYLNRPELTAEKFVTDPFVTGERMYRSGDLARWRPDGTVEFIGRMDHQIKLRGFRVELGEIEAELLKQPSVTEALVVAKQEASGYQYLCAYIVAEKEVAAARLKEELQQSLPDYMIPASVMQLAKMPLTPNGKIDRKALPEPAGGIRTGAEYVAPRNEAEARMAQVWQEVLAVEKVGIEDNFFELGGHSLKVIALVAGISEKMGMTIPYEQIFKTPTVKQIVQYAATAASVKQVFNNYTVFKARDCSRRNLFFFPPAVPLGLIYRHLADELDDCTLYCFNLAAGEDKVQEYVNDITGIQPRGPYILAGYSAGGVLTFEVARELERQGYAVAGILLIDCQYAKIPDESIGLLMERVDRFLEDMAVAAAEKSSIKKFLEKNTVNYLRYLNSLIQDSRIAADIYHIYSLQKPDLSVVDEWGPKTAGGFAKYEGPGPHDLMLEPGYVAENAKILRGIIRKMG
ncbi:phosphopantetheine attachment site [Lucifera butyrica]|uniref:Phosphopantetheine attachment site n=1 Tax=Lucifera butyrica TaxID=1351585 RepID=A0A498R7L4_9FIRM|nr:non-ribosomal peptide synthetase [Lucifera butyrica]VBB05118.1 phosphopantetheine attachment site [Lucifera butyrica]